MLVLPAGRATWPALVRRKKAKRALRGAVPWVLALPLLSAWLRHIDWHLAATAVTVVWRLLALITTMLACYGLFSFGSAIADKQQLPRDDARFALLIRCFPLALVYGVAVLVYGLLIAPFLMQQLLAVLGT
jgi:hypothetical protein